jgi:hypothetical protein
VHNASSQMTLEDLARQVEELGSGVSELRA